jgi:FKBP-type peptidyl-prolyl cis-trans isomerase SlyD
MMIEGQTGEESGEDSVFYTVTEIADGKAVLDGNHPLAGTALVFSCTVDAVRPATAEEIETANKPHSAC